MSAAKRMAENKPMASILRDHDLRRRARWLSLSHWGMFYTGETSELYPIGHPFASRDWADTQEETE